MPENSYLEEFEAEFRELLDGAAEQFRLPPPEAVPDAEYLTDIDRLQLAESHLKRSIEKAKAELEAAKHDLQREGAPSPL